MLLGMGSRATSRAGPALTFVVPAFRAEAYLLACLDSLLTEAGDEVEVIGVDDASPDACGEMLDGYTARDRRVHVIHLPANLGPGHARNAGLELATGTYVWFVDSDDWLPHGTVPAVLARLRAHQPDVLVVDHAEAFPDGRVGASRPHRLLHGVSGPTTLTAHPELLRVAQSACTKIARKGLLDETKLRFAPGWYEDGTFSHALLMAASTIDVFDRVCYLYRQWELGTTRTTSPRHFEVFEQYRQLFERVDEHYPHLEAYRGELFRLMIDHYLVIVGHEARVPPSQRRDFYGRVHAEYHARFPHGGYPRPRGVQRLKHRLVRGNAYRTYAVLRQAYRPVRLLRRAVRLRHSRRAGTSVPGR